MTQVVVENPFHAGELEAQARAGAGDVAKWAHGFIRDYMPEQHRDFYTSLPFLVVAGGDTEGRTWVTLLDGAEGFIRSANPRSLSLETDIAKTDPLAAAFAAGTDVGVVGIELASRRRNRFSGCLRKAETGYTIDIKQTFGNCPQYIHERSWTRAPRRSPGGAVRGTTLDASQIALIQKSDTMFIGSGHQQGADGPSRGFDASHRGGAPGFVHVESSSHLRIPDYAGNNFFNTIGNLLSDPRIGLVFVDFDTGGLLHVSGRATIDWQPENAHDPDAWRMIDVQIDSVIERPGALALRWAKQDQTQRLRVTRREREAQDITSFYLEQEDGNPLSSFKSGQHLPIEVHIPNQSRASKRTYSLSGGPDAEYGLRLSIKREGNGLVSRYFHDQLQVGDVIKASAPAGEFVIPCNSCPLVLVSAGVGLTPMVSMLHALVSDDDPRPVWYVHGARNGNEHALKAEVEGLIARSPQMRQRVFYSSPEDRDVLGKDYHVTGRITAASLQELVPGLDAHYMLCGPAQFMSDIRHGLEAAGVPEGNIHIESFGPAG